MRTVYGAEVVDGLLNKNENEDNHLDEDEWHDQEGLEIQRREEEAVAARLSELGRLGFTFSRSVQQADHTWTGARAAVPGDEPRAAAVRPQSGARWGTLCRVRRERASERDMSGI